MPTIPKTYEGTQYVSHTVEKVELRHAPSKRWSVSVKTSVPEGATELPFDGLFDIPADMKKTSQRRAVDTFVDGMKKRWEKRTSASSEWVEALRADLMKAIDED